MTRGRLILVAIFALGALAVGQVERAPLLLAGWVIALVLFLAAYCLRPGILGDDDQP